MVPVQCRPEMVKWIKRPSSKNPDAGIPCTLVALVIDINSVFTVVTTHNRVRPCEVLHQNVPGETWEPENREQLSSPYLSEACGLRYCDSLRHLPYSRDGPSSLKITVLVHAKYAWVGLQTVANYNEVFSSFCVYCGNFKFPVYRVTFKSGFYFVRLS